jgi:hypothetical protein
MRVRTDCLMPRANNARGKVFGALPRIPARGTPPGTGVSTFSTSSVLSLLRRQVHSDPNMSLSILSYIDRPT